MKALELDENKKLAIVDAPIPKPGKGEVLVKLKSGALNHREIWIGKGLYPGMTLPCILGADGAGVITEVGPEVEKSHLNTEVIVYPAYDWGSDENNPRKGFRVLGMPDPGTLAEYIRVPVKNVEPKPNYLTWNEAAAIPVASLTAWRALSKYGRIKSGDKVLITGIGGGVAQAGLQIAKAFGAEVYVTSSSLLKIEDAKGRGASGGVNYKEAGWNFQLKDLSRGIDIVLDSSPSENLDDYLKFLNMGARVVAYGSTGSRKTTLNISKFFLRHIQFIGTAMGSPKDFSDLLSFMEQHEIRPRVHEVFPLDKSIEAMASLEEGKQMGKIVIEIN